MNLIEKHLKYMKKHITFDKNDFLSACKEMGITKDLKGDK